MLRRLNKFAIVVYLFAVVGLIDLAKGAQIIASKMAIINTRGIESALAISVFFLALFHIYEYYKRKDKGTHESSYNFEQENFSFVPDGEGMEDVVYKKDINPIEILKELQTLKGSMTTEFWKEQASLYRQYRDIRFFCLNEQKKAKAREEKYADLRKKSVVVDFDL